MRWHQNLQNIKALPCYVERWTGFRYKLLVSCYRVTLHTSCIVVHKAVCKQHHPWEVAVSLVWYDD